jgi:hypothetical protein
MGDPREVESKAKHFFFEKNRAARREAKNFCESGAWALALTPPMPQHKTY